ncbi:hypothetical protein [Aureivirga sp. CE67]|uniref:hypothetical protein n=1 Tax=Aureivirga sp. CE67 TaxID=1788983 RepID=UPI0018CBC81D|nr:hypothetical protein [Aureivirga sp. CE67]
MNTKKITSLLLLLFISIVSFGQVSVGKTHIGKPKKIKPEIFDRFKKSTTIFVLSNVHEKSKYKEILDEVWTVSPYKLVDESDFNYQDYYFGNYSVGKLDGYTSSYRMKNGTLVERMHVYLDIYLYQNESDLKKIAKGKKTKEEILKKLKNPKHHDIARVQLSANWEFIALALNTAGTTSNDIYQMVYNDEIATNNSLGFFKNNMQKINALIQKEERYWLYDTDSKDSELKKLATGTLYVPDNIKQYFRMMKNRKDPSAEAQLKKMKDGFEKAYPYKYEIIEPAKLDQMILDEKPIYYLRFAFVNGQKFIHVVNAQTGEVVFRKYKKASLSFSLKEKHIKAISKAVKKAAK